MEKLPGTGSKKTPSKKTDFDTKPILVSWVCGAEATGGSEQEQGRFGICHCPGKQIAMGRDGKAHNRSIQIDAEQFRAVHGVSQIICLLNQYELRTLGVDSALYKKACEKNEISLLFLPVIEMGQPELEMPDFDRFLEENILARVAQGQRVVAHCRGGIGRAGLIACCVLLKRGQFRKSEDAIAWVRKQRDKRCVESRRQADYIKSYELYLQAANKLV